MAVLHFQPLPLPNGTFSRFPPRCQSHLAPLFSCWSKSTTHPELLLLHLKQATLSLCASVSSHLLSWHRAHTCRLTTSSQCMLLLSKPGDHLHTHTHTHDHPSVFRGSSGFTERSQRAGASQEGHKWRPGNTITSRLIYGVFTLR